MARVPGDLILEPNERVVLATRPLFLWEPLAILEVLLFFGSLYLYGRSGAAGRIDVRSPQLEYASYALLVLFVLLLVWIVVKWVPWSRKWFVLTDRRVIARWGVLNRNQAALLLDRIQDASLTRPFPLSLIRDYGSIHLESAGEHAQERISGGLEDLDMTGATGFYRALTDQQTRG